MDETPRGNEPPRKTFDIKPSDAAENVRNGHPEIKEEPPPALRPLGDSYFLYRDKSRRHKLPRGIWWGILGLIIIFVVSFTWLLYSSARRASGALTENLSEIQAGVADLKNLNTQSAAQKFSNANDNLNATLGGLVSKLGPLLGDTGDLIKGFQGLTSLGVIASQQIGQLQNDFLPLFLNNGGDRLITELKSLRDTLTEVQSQSDEISAGLSKLGDFAPTAPNFYLPLLSDVGRWRNFLDSLIGWLSSGSPHHILVLFQNPSEIRPAGGFLGSYADIVIASGSLSEVNVHDINDADRQFPLKIIPPKPLQAQITSLPAQAGWRAADANWFFDFPQSAAKVASFVEASKLYSASDTTFDDVIAVSPKVIEDILSITGPVTVNGISLDAGNFLVQLQRQVQAGQAQHATYPKGILDNLTSLLSSKLGGLDEAGKRALIADAENWLADKDIMLYSNDADFQKFFDYYDISGRVYELPADFNGDYLALIDANIGGGKSDLYVSSTMMLESQIDIDGTVDNHLVITRVHLGNTSPYWWYKVQNQDYLQLFVPAGSQISNFSGGLVKKIAPPINYARSGYQPDPDILEIESSTEAIFNYPALREHTEDSLQVFSTWSKVSAGEKSQLTFDYSHRLFLPPAEGQTYEFIFEKQAGTQRHYDFTISAPVGYKFKENNLPVYEFVSDGPPGRLIVSLTLEKI